MTDEKILNYARALQKLSPETRLIGLGEYERWLPVDILWYFDFTGHPPSSLVQILQEHHLVNSYYRGS